MSDLTILNTAIRQTQNLYSLNDLHIAGGAESKHKPSNFARLDTTQDLVAEIRKKIQITLLLFVKMALAHTPAKNSF
ncbi:KilA-N domain-containing protein [Rodentibacter pneumotropicus]|uniref:KilA-N domain-containing protein n=1 Tax=Rodentibacter pneumotropicus TaxID=758 RepID=UPI0023579FCF|nr:KilA-N domain-containing protein [Rodentibacter pneumotropicus]